MSIRGTRREARGARAFIGAVLLAASLCAGAQSSEIAKPDAAVERRLKSLAEELRCLVCQNQTIADSNAPLAIDLRNQLRGQIAAGRSDDDIRSYMVERYGDFVLYRPPMRATTVLLWVGPFALVVVGAGIFFLMVRRRRRGEPAKVSASRRDEIEALLDGVEAPGEPKARAGGAGNARRPGGRDVR